MHVVTVTFEIHPEATEAFLPLMRQNARLSAQTEPGCQRFDVCTDPASPTTIFLYEIYDSEAAFADHLAAAHYLEFAAQTDAMVAAKTVKTYTLLPA